MTDVVCRVFTVLRSTRVRAILACGIVFGLGTVGTMAAWSATNTTTSGTFTTGSVDLWLNDVNATTTAPLTVPLGSSLLPGQSGAVIINVQNRGISAGNYTTQARATNAAGQAVRLSVVVGGSVSGSTCMGTPSVSNLALTATNVSLLGTRGPLAATSGSDSLCLQFTLPTSAPNAVQSTTGTVIFTFTGSAVAGV